MERFNLPEQSDGYTSTAVKIRFNMSYITRFYKWQMYTLENLILWVQVNRNSTTNKDEKNKFFLKQILNNSFNWMQVALQI